MEIITTKEHFDKYKNLCDKYGKFINLPYSKAEIVHALEANKALNSIPLHKWDGLMNLPLRLSLSEKVSILKHFAIYRIAECTPKVISTKEYIELLKKGLI